MQDYQTQSSPLKVSEFGANHATAIVVLASLVLLIMIRRGFRGVSAGGISVNVR